MKLDTSIGDSVQVERFVEGGLRYKYFILVPVLLAFPWVAPLPDVSLAIEIAIFAIFAMSYNVLQGYTGVVSFGHALFLGLGGYTAGALLVHVAPSLPLALGGAILLTVVVAAVVGVLSIRREGVYFAMISLAFAQLAYLLMFKLDWLGGYNGMTGIPSPEPFGVALTGLVNYYYFTLVLAAITLLAIRRVVKSPFGLSMKLVRENQHRAASLGYNVERVKIISLCLSAIFAALAGGLLVINNSFVSPNILYFTHSADAIFMVIIGGQGTLAGPIIGAASLIFIRDELSGILVRWRLVLGLLFILFSIRFQSGVMGFLEKLRE